VKHSTKPPTKAEAARFDLLRSIGCLCCRKIGLPMQGGVTEIHHLLSGNRRRGHEYTVPLCAYHHRAVPWSGFTSKQMAEAFGPSLAKGSKPFHKFFGSDDSLLAEVNKMIGITEAA
jgi:hypothetical protein